jgi:hypothetical protein
LVEQRTCEENTRPNQVDIVDLDEDILSFVKAALVDLLVKFLQVGIQMRGNADRVEPSGISRKLSCFSKNPNYCSFGVCLTAELWRIDCGSA